MSDMKKPKQAIGKATRPSRATDDGQPMENRRRRRSVEDPQKKRQRRSELKKQEIRSGEATFRFAVRTLGGPPHVRPHIVVDMGRGPRDALTVIAQFLEHSHALEFCELRKTWYIERGV